MADEEMTSRARSFDHGASAYERLRPHYPAELFDDLVATAGGRLGRGVLEVGAGTGRATLPLARRGFRLQVVDPSADMLRVLRESLDDEGLLGSVALRRATFEEVTPEDGLFAVVVAAQSFHWADAATRWARLASLLTDDGLAFLFWNGWQLDPESHDLNGVLRAYEGHAAGLVPDVDDFRGGASWAEEEIAAEPLLDVPVLTKYAWDWRLGVEDYLGLLGTVSEYAVAGPDVRRALFGALRPALGDQVLLRGRTTLLAVGRAPGSPH